MRDASVRLYHITELVSWLSLVERVFFAPKCEPYRSAWGNSSILLLTARWKVGSARSIPMFRASFAAAPCRRRVRATRTARSADSYSICMAAMPLRRTHSAAWACMLCHHVYRIRRSCLSTLMHLHVHVLCLYESGMIVCDNSSEFGSKLLKTICSSILTTSISIKTITSPCTTRATKLVRTYIQYGQRCTQAALAFRSQYHLLWEAIAWEPAN